MRTSGKLFKIGRHQPTLKNIKESFLGSVNYLSKFIPYLSAHRKPLQDLLKQSSVDAEFSWLDTHTEAFNKLKTAICKDITLKYFDSSLPIYIECDASKKGISVVMLQPDLSHSMPARPSLTQNPIIQILSMKCWVLYSVYCISNILHLVAQCILLLTIKPLITLFRKNLHATSPKLNHMLVQILDNNIEFHYQEGTKMHLSDALSRLNTHDSAVEKSKAKLVADFNITIHDVEILTGFKSLSLDQVHREIECDTDMQLLKQHTLDGFPKSRSCLPESIRSFLAQLISCAITNHYLQRDCHCRHQQHCRQKLTSSSVPI